MAGISGKRNFKVVFAGGLIPANTTLSVAVQKVTGIEYKFGTAEHGNGTMNKESLHGLQVISPKIEGIYTDDPFDVLFIESMKKMLFANGDPITGITAPYDARTFSMEVFGLASSDLYPTHIFSATVLCKGFTPPEFDKVSSDNATWSAEFTVVNVLSV